MGPILKPEAAAPRERAAAVARAAGTADALPLPDPFPLYRGGALRGAQHRL